MRDTIKKILEIAIHAPSGDNCQPWKFKSSGNNSIELINIPDRDTSLYNLDNRSVFTAHGALIENICIAAQHYNLEARVNLLPTSSSANIVATISFVQQTSENSEDVLYEHITQRATNRKPYLRRPLSEGNMTALHKIGDTSHEVQLRMIKDPHSLEQLARAFAQNETILFSNYELHNFFYKHIHWSIDEAKEFKTGFPATTLEIPLAGLPFFRMLGNWNIMRIFRNINLQTAIANNNQKTYASCGAMFAFVVHDTAPIQYIHMGRMLQRLWLTSSTLQLSFQPLMGIVFLMERIRRQKTETLSEKQQRIISEAYFEIERQFNAEGEFVIGACRIGESDSPSGNTFRLPLALID